MDKQQLKPCPFCGSEANLGRDDGGWWVARCTSCETLTCGHDAEAKAATVWNDRTPQPPSASDERERYVDWLSGTFPGIYSVEEASRWWSQEHISALAWEARAALAPSPGVDAAEQKPVPLNVIREWPDGLAEMVDATLLDTVGYTLNYRLYDLQQAMAKYGFTMTVAEAVPSPAASTDEWMAEHERLVDALLVTAGSEPRSFNATEYARTALLAHLKERP